MTSLRHPEVTAILITVCLASTLSGHTVDPTYQATIEKWREEREARLRADDGWLTVAGLYWLKNGENRFGTDPLNDIVLNVPAPLEIGVFDFRGGQTTVRIEDGVTVLLHGKPVHEAELKPGAADSLVIGDVSLFVHQSGDRYAIRVRDKNSRLRREFTGCKWFPVNEAFRVTGRFKPYPAPKAVEVPNILGDMEHYTSPGTMEFTVSGQTFDMQAITSDQRLWFIFRDLTSGKETYPSARFLYADPTAADGTVVLDFNKATNPPCAFNPYTTCPLPPEQNKLRTRIEAGELKYREHETSSE